MFITAKEAKKFSFEPYEDCPCESGNKYKFCCYEKSKSINPKDVNFNPQRVLFESQQAFRTTDFETCFGFDTDECSKNIIGAHSLQNNGVLDKITTDNHVYHLVSTIKDDNMTMKFDKIGKNQASKFKGFCKEHDKSYFSSIEDAEYFGTDEQNYWFAFRAFCFELHRKQRLKKHFPNIFRKYPQATKHPSILTFYRSCELDLKDKEIEYTRFKNIYENKAFNQMESFIKVLPFRVAFTGTTAVAVNVDIEGNETIDIYNYDEKVFIPSVYISVIPKQESTLIIVSRHVDDLCYETLINNLKKCNDDDKLLKYITFCLTEFSENVYFCPQIIDDSSQQIKDRIVAAFESSLSPNPETRMYTMLQAFKLNLFEFSMP